MMIKFGCFSVQPGYLRELLPDSAPVRPESLQDVLDGNFLKFILTSNIL